MPSKEPNGVTTIKLLPQFRGVLTLSEQIIMGRIYVLTKGIEGAECWATTGAFSQTLDIKVSSIKNALHKLDFIKAIYTRLDGTNGNQKTIIRLTLNETEINRAYLFSAKSYQKYIQTEKLCRNKNYITPVKNQRGPRQILTGTPSNFDPHIMNNNDLSIEYISAADKSASQKLPSREDIKQSFCRFIATERGKKYDYLNAEDTTELIYSYVVNKFDGAITDLDAFIGSTVMKWKEFQKTGMKPANDHVKRKTANYDLKVNYRG